MPETIAHTTLDLPVLGMTCAACVRRVERAALAVPGITSAEVNLPLSRARIVIDPALTTIGAAAAAIRAAGYEVPADAISEPGSAGSPASGAARLAAIERAQGLEHAGLRRDAVLAIAATVPLLVIAMAHGVFDSTASVIAQLALGSVVVLGPGARYFRAGVRAVAHRSPDMNTLIALGSGAAWLSSAVSAARWLAGPRIHAPELYFEAAAAIVAFVMVGKLLEARARSRLADAVRGLLSLAPSTARRVVDGQDHDVEAAALAAGDIILVRPGERIAADGTVIEGRSAVDEALLTGESMPVDKAEGAPVYAGTLNHHGALSIRVARAGADTSLARIARAVEDAQGTKAPIARLADRVSAVFVPIVLVIAAVTLGAWLVAGVGSAVAIERMVAVLVIACPCALGLATPAAVAVGTARGAELGILFRSGAALERASTINVVCLDKTGTLTTGKPTLLEMAASPSATPAVTLPELAVIASAELASEHPIARAIVDGARARGLALERPTDATVEPGAGISATVTGKRVLVGTADFLALAGIALPAELAAPPGATVSHGAIDGRYVGIVAVADPPAAEARATITALRALGIEPILITGDREAAAHWIASEVGITQVHAGARPTAKAAIVASERSAGPHRSVAMVGDGINDAPALAAADLGIALGSGTDIAASAAEVTLLRGGIGALPTALALARATLRTIRRNLAAASIYNVVCIPIAAAGLLSPVLASAAMSLSSVSVLLSSLRLRKWAP
ncbi:MAG: copper-translocating P-type ATPase [Deltaproteobacteria bacterium]|nr:copper-translocating P-type ATPase [Deltaproteobacteria bacterium]